MTKLPKIFLTLSIVGFAVSLTGPGGEFAAGAIKPFSAICFILFYITQLLAKEIEAYDEEQHAKLESPNGGRPVSPKSGAKSASHRGHSPSLAGVGTR